MSGVILALAVSWAFTYYFKEVRPAKNRLKNARRVIFIR